MLKDPIKAKAIFENLGAKTNHLFEVLEAYADLIENPEERRVFKEKLEKLKCMNDELIRLGLAAANDPKNQKLIDEYNRKYKEYIKALESIVPPEKVYFYLYYHIYILIYLFIILLFVSALCWIASLQCREM